MNDLLDKIEDPERMLKQLVIDMENNIADVKSSVLEAIASEKRLAYEVEKQQKQAALWTEKASLALTQNEETLARAALARKQTITQNLLELEPAWQMAQASSERLKTRLRELEQALTEAQHKRAALVARQRAAESQQALQNTATHFRHNLDSKTRLARMSEQVADMEAHSAALSELDGENNSLEKDFERMKTDKAVDDELATLKAALDK
jgi:phage shock protein A